MPLTEEQEQMIYRYPEALMNVMFYHNAGHPTLVTEISRTFRDLAIAGLIKLKSANRLPFEPVRYEPHPTKALLENLELLKQVHALKQMP